MHEVEMVGHGSARKKRPRRFPTLLFASFLVLAILGLAAVPHFIMPDVMRGPVSFDHTFDPETFGLTAQRLDLETSDGLTLRAHRVLPGGGEPRAVIIFLSGTHNPSVTAFFGHAAMMAEAGYASLLVEMRAHLPSEGDRVSLGIREHLDVAAAVEHIRGDPELAGHPIVAYGLSMGGAAAINAAGSMEAIDALVALSAYSSWPDVFVDNMVESGLPRALAPIQRPFVTGYLMLHFGGEAVRMTPRRQIANLGGRPALLIHSTRDSQVPYASLGRLRDAAPDHVETWSREGDMHLIVEGDFTDPAGDAEYAERVLDFLDRHFGPATH